MSKVTLEQLGLGADDLAAIGKLSEKGMTPEQIADAVEKVSMISSSASEIDGSVSRKHKFIMGDNLYDIYNKKNLFDINTFSITSIPNGMPIYENDYTITKYSKNSLKLGNLTHGVSTRLDMIKSLPIVYNLGDINFFTFWVYVPDELVSDGSYSSDFGEFRFFFANDNSTGLGTKFISLNISLQVGWNNITLTKQQFSIPMGSGVFDWNTVSKIRIQFNTGVGNIGIPIYIDSLFCGGDESSLKTPIVMTLDDSFPDTYPMTKIMNSYGVPVSNFIIPSFIDDIDNYLNIEDVKDLYDQGNHIGIHGTGLNNFAVNPQNIILARDWLIANGFTRNDGHLYGTYPNGTYSQSTIDLLQQNNFKGFRTVAQRPRDDSQSVQSSKGKSYHECIFNGGIAEPLKINGVRSATYELFITDIEEAILNKTAYIGYYHLFSEVSGYENWLKMAAYLKQKVDEGLIECLTFPEFVQKYS